MAPRELVNPIADLFDAAVRHMTVQLRCPRCGWTAHFDPHAMWWLFERKGWNDRISQVVAHFYCDACRARGGAPVRPRIALLDVSVPIDARLEMPTEQVWKRMLSRRR